MSDQHHPPAAPFDATHDLDNPSSLVVIYLVVVGLSAASILATLFLHLGKYALPVQMAFGTAQAGLVSFFWMHLRRKDKVVTLTALAALFWTGILFVLFLSDFMSRYYGGL